MSGMTTIFGALLLILGLFPVVVLLCQPAQNIGDGKPDPRPWHEILTTALLRLFIGFGLLYALYWLAENA